MPDLRPFRGLRYDPLAVPDLSAVICPPYDVIGAEQRTSLAARHPRNAVHVELPGQATGTPSASPEADAVSGNGPYAAAAELFARWRSDGTLRTDARPMIYAYEQVLPGDETERGSDGRCRGFFCRLRLEPPGPGAGVLPHEHTLAGPREDRYRLLRAVRANLSPVLLLYHQVAGEAPVGVLLDQLMNAPADSQATADDGVVHRLWAVDPARSAPAAALLRAAGGGPLTIADGHHRYQTALRFRDDARAAAGRADGGVGGDAAEYLLVLLYEARTGGLRIAPTHRLVLDVPETEALFAAAAELFDVELCATAEGLLAGLAGGVIGLWTRHGGGLLAPRRERLAGYLPPAASEALRWLDVSILSAALGPLLGLEPQVLEATGRLAYDKDARAAIAAVDDGAADACFLLSPTPVDAVIEVAANGEFMPPKSTYFWPKAATGLVFNPLAG